VEYVAIDVNSTTKDQTACYIISRQPKTRNHSLIFAFCGTSFRGMQKKRRRIYIIGTSGQTNK